MEREAGPQEHRRDRRCSERNRESVHVLEPVGDEDTRGREPAHDRGRGERAALELDAHPAGRLLPGRAGDQEQRLRPERVEQRALHVGARGGLEEVDAVGHSGEGKGETDRRPRVG